FRLNACSPMKALTFAGVEQIHYETVPDPTLRDPGDAIVRILRSGICWSDLHIYHGRETGLDLGTVMGHEFAGDIVGVGSEVRRFRTGDRVCSPFSTSCGQCFFCHKGLTARCANGGCCFGWVQNGRGVHGAQAEYLRVPLADTTLMMMPDGVTLEEA